MKPNSNTTPKLYCGIDGHKEQTAVVIADPNSADEIRSHGNITKSRGLQLTDLHVDYKPL